MIQRISKLYIFLFLPIASFSQNIPIETWRNHFSFNRINNITSSENSIICSGDNGLFFVNKQSGETTLLAKQDGLSDVSPADIHYDIPSNSLVLCYESGLIDIYRDSKNITVKSIYESLLSGDKSIKDITVSNGKIYAANGFGIVVVNITNGEVIESYQSIGSGATDVVPNEVHSTPNYLVTITDQGLMAGALDQNLLDFNNWTLLEESTNSFRDLTTIDNDHIAVIVNDTAIFSYNLSDHSSRLLFSSAQELTDLTSVGEEIYYISANNLYQLGGPSIQSFNIEIRSAYYDDGFWIATENEGLIDPSGSIILLNGPLSDNIQHIQFAGNQLFALYTPDVEEINSETAIAGYDQFDNYNWEHNDIDNFSNISDVAYFNEHYYFSSLGYGLYDLTDNSTVTLENSTTTNDLLLTSISASKELYVACYDHQTPLMSLSKDQIITTYPVSYTGTQYPIDVDVSQGENIWLQRSIYDGGGFMVLDLADEEYRLITSQDGLSSNDVNALAISYSDEAWIATSNGLVSFSDATYIFDNQEAIDAYFDNNQLFSNKNVTATIVDGGNRVWVGTEDEGIWVFDSNFSQLEYRFTFLNSPLPSNHIKEFTYNPETGEMYILTNHGLSSFRSNSSLGGIEHSDVSIYPNPVRPGYSGKVGINGLVNNAVLRITDVNGKLIRELQVNGGSASWDLYDYNNHKVQSGIYILFSSDSFGEETYIGKLAVINQ